MNFLIFELKMSSELQDILYLAATAVKMIVDVPFLLSLKL